MITKEFVLANTPSTTTVVSPITGIIPPDKNFTVLRTLKQRHCPNGSNHTKELLAFASAARASGIDKYTTENFIENNIVIATESSKADPKQLHNMIADAYERYPNQNFSPFSNITNGNNCSDIMFKNNYDKNEVEGIIANYEKYKVTSTKNYPKPDPIISINGSSIATPGNIMTISGVQKTGKSSLCNIVLSGCLSNKLDGVPESLKITPSNGKAVIRIDTEQAEAQQQKNLKYAILKRSGLAVEPENYHEYNVRSLCQAEAIKMLNDTFFALHEKHGGIHLVLIDGLADFISSVNDEVQSNQIVKLIEQLAIKYNTLVIVVIHRNPNDSKIRGHLGSHILRKSETVLVTKKDGDCFYIEAEALRTASNGDIPKFLFQYDKNKGYHCCTGAEKSGTNDGQFNELANTLENGKVYTTLELRTLICSKRGVRSAMASKLIANMTDEGLLIRVGHGSYKKPAEDLFTDEPNVENP